MPEPIELPSTTDTEPVPEPVPETEADADADAEAEEKAAAAEAVPTRAAVAEGKYQQGIKFYNKQDYSKAEVLFEEAERQEHTHAPYYLGLINYHGHISGTKDYAEAKKSFEKVAEAGHSDAQYYLGLMYYNGQVYSKAKKWFEKAARQEHVGAHYYMGLMYKDGIGGVDQSDGIAGLLFEKAANKNEPDAQCMMGRIYRDGLLGYKKSKEEAKKWFKKAADQGQPFAALKMGVFYYKAQDYQNARDYLNIARNNAREDYHKASGESAKIGLTRIDQHEEEMNARTPKTPLTHKQRRENWSLVKEEGLQRRDKAQKKINAEKLEDIKRRHREYDPNKRGGKRTIHKRNKTRQGTRKKNKNKNFSRRNSHGRKKRNKRRTRKTKY